MYALSNIAYTWKTPGRRATTIINNLQILTLWIRNNFSNDEMLYFERLGVSQEKDIFTVPDL